MDEAGRALFDAAQSARNAGDYLTLERIARELLALADDAPNGPLRAYGYYLLGFAMQSLNRTSDAIAATTEAIRRYEELGDRLEAARATMNLGVIEIDNNNDVAKCRKLYDASLPTIRELGEPALVGTALANMSEALRFEGDYRGALRDAEEALTIFRGLGDDGGVAWVLADIAHYQLLLRRPGEAIASMHASYAALQRDPNPRWTAWYFDVWFLIAARLGRFDVAAQLLAFTDRFRDEQNQPRSLAMLPWFSAPRERLAHELSHERLEEAIIAGESLTVESAHRLVSEMEGGIE